MGIDYYIGGDQVRITSAYWYNEFLNWVAMMGEYPQILDHSPIHGSYDNDHIGLYKGNIKELKKELETLIEMNPPEYAEDIINYMLEGCNLALDKDEKITLDDGAWGEDQEE